MMNKSNEIRGISRQTQEFIVVGQIRKFCESLEKRTALTTMCFRHQKHSDSSIETYIQS